MLYITLITVPEFRKDHILMCL